MKRYKSLSDETMLTRKRLIVVDNDFNPMEKMYLNHPKLSQKTYILNKLQERQEFAGI